MSLSSAAQLSVKPFLFVPTGELGFVGERAMSIEVGYINSSLFEQDWRTRASLTLFNLKPRMDVFPTVGTLESGNEITVIPGEQRFSKFKMGLLTVGVDRQIIGNDNIKIYLGFDLQTGAASIDYESNMPLIEELSYSGGGTIGAFRFRLGSEFLITDEFTVGIEANRHYGIITSHMLYSANDFGLNLCYYF